MGHQRMISALHVTEPSRTPTPSSSARPRAWTASLTIHVAFVTTVLVVAAGSAPDVTWAGMIVTSSTPSLWADHQVEPEAAATAARPEVHFEPPPTTTVLLEPVLAPLESSERLLPTDDDEPLLAEIEPEPHRPDWSARVAVHAAVQPKPDTPAAVVASSAAPDGAIVPPSPIAGQNPPPTYPKAARRRGIEGEVTVILEIATDGSVDAAHVEVSSGSSLLDDSALQQLAKWMFEPSRRAGIAVRGTYRTVVAFALEN